MDPRDLFGWNRGANKDAAQRARDTGEPVELNWYETLMGGSAEDAQNINKRLKQKELNTQLSGSAAQYGVSGADWGESRGDYQKRIFAAKNKKEEKDKVTAHTRDKDIITAGQATGLEQIKATERTSTAQIAAGDRRASENMTLLQQQMLNESRESRLDRAERADQRADDRMMQIEMFERADRKEEKNRRRESIQSLVAGLASLGAAFAV